MVLQFLSRNFPKHFIHKENKQFWLCARAPGCIRVLSEVCWGSSRVKSVRNAFSSTTTCPTDEYKSATRCQYGGKYYGFRQQTINPGKGISPDFFNCPCPANFAQSITLHERISLRNRSVNDRKDHSYCQRFT